MNDLGLPWFLDILNSADDARVSAAQYCLQTILNSLSGLTNKQDAKPVKEMCEGE
jgi:hypothetical protein